MNDSALCMYRKTHKRSCGLHQNQLATTYHGHIILQPVGIVQPPYHHPFNTPSNMVTVIHVHMMNVEQTANWVRTFSAHRAWQEAGVYAMSFRINSVNGIMLKHLNHEILRFDMGMSNDMHRLDLLAVIRQLFPSYYHCKVTSEPTRLSDLFDREKKCDHRQKAVSDSPIIGSSNPVEDEPRTGRYLVRDRTESLGMDSSSVKNNSNNSVNTSSGSEMEVSDRKFPSSRARKPLSLRTKLQQRESTALYPPKNANYGGVE